MSLRELCERSFSVDGNSGPVAAWRRAVSAAIDGGGGGGGGNRIDGLLYFSRAAVPSSESPGVIMDAGPQPSESDTPVGAILLPPGTWRVVSATVTNTSPEGSSTGSYALFNVTTGNPLGTATLGSGVATPANFTLTGAAQNVEGPAILNVNIGGSAAEPALSAPQVAVVIEAVPD